MDRRFRDELDLLQYNVTLHNYKHILGSLSSCLIYEPK